MEHRRRVEALLLHDDHGMAHESTAGDAPFRPPAMSGGPRTLK